MNIRCLESKIIKEEFSEFCSEANIEVLTIDIGENIEPFLCMQSNKVQQVIKLIRGIIYY